MSDLITLQKRYVELYDQLADLAEQSKKLQDEKDKLEPILAEQMTAIGQNSTHIDGRRLTVRTTPRIGKKGEVSTEALCEALKGTEWAFLVKEAVNAQTLQATMKEVVEEKGSLPPELEPLLRKWDQTVVAVTKR